MRAAVQLALSTVAQAPVASPDLTRVPPDAEIVDSQGATWTRPPPDNFVTRDGVAKPWGGCHALKYVSGRVWFLDSGAWHQLSVDGARIEQSQATEPGTGEPPPPPPPPVNRDPVWDTSLIIFEQGIAAALDLRTRASDPDGDPLTFAEVSPPTGLPAGFSWDANAFRLAYDGSDLGLADGDQPIEFDTGLRLSADDGRAPATFQ